LNKSDAGVYNNFGNYYDRLSRGDKSNESYTKALATDNKYIAAYYNFGNAYIKIAKEKLAIKNLTKVLELDKGFIRPMTTAVRTIRSLVKIIWLKKIYPRRSPWCKLNWNNKENSEQRRRKQINCRKKIQIIGIARTRQPLR
jgi:tetratricopeptide (TPR) repeat protein